MQGAVAWVIAALGGNVPAERVRYVHWHYHWLEHTAWDLPARWGNVLPLYPLLYSLGGTERDEPKKALLRHLAEGVSPQQLHDVLRQSERNSMETHLTAIWLLEVQGEAIALETLRELLLADQEIGTAAALFIARRHLHALSNC